MIDEEENWLDLEEEAESEEVACVKRDCKGTGHVARVNVTTTQVKIQELLDVTRTTGKAGKCERMDSPLSLEVVQCRQFDPVTGPFTMNERCECIYTIYPFLPLMLRTRASLF